MKTYPWIVAMGLAAVALVMLARPASVQAHARLETSSPSKGEIVAVSPDEVELVFSQDIQRISGKYGIEVTKDRGSSVTSGPAIVDADDRSKMSVPLQPDLADGRYVVRWNNVSDDDGDPLEGAFSFYVNYQPNAIDLENDDELAQIGEEAANATGTPSGSDTPTSDPTPSISQSPADTPAASPTANAGDGDSGSSSSTMVIAIIGAVVGVAVVGVAAFYFVRNRSA